MLTQILSKIETITSHNKCGFLNSYYETVHTYLHDNPASKTFAVYRKPTKFFNHCVYVIYVHVRHMYMYMFLMEYMYCR